MKVHEWTKLLLLVALAAVWPQPASAQHDGDHTVVEAQGLKEDLQVLNRALSELHPGLHRYTDPETLQREFQSLEQQLAQDTPLDQVYLAISRFLAQIKCGHTYANFWNQQDAVQNELFHGPNKVPFAFRILNGRMYVTADATVNGSLERGAEVLSLNGVAVPEVLKRLMPLVKSDGSNDGKRMYDLQIAGTGKFESFDVYYPLVFSVKHGRYDVEVRQPGSDQVSSIEVAGVTREERRMRMSERYGEQPQSPEDQWQFELMDDSTGYLRLGTFVIWDMEMDWKKFLRNSFKTMRDEGVENLVLDIRGNEGGADEVTLELTKYLVTKPLQMSSVRQLMRYVKVPEDLNPYLHTWDDSFRNRGRKVVDAGNGFYTWRKASNEGLKLRPGKRAFSGQVYLLVDAANSSATFMLAATLKDNGLATLVGQPTGGNRRGINGGQMFFLRLPNSKVEVDIPLIGYYRGKDEPDEGVSPDVVSEPTAGDVAAGIDTELEVVRRLIAQRM